MEENFEKEKIIMKLHNLIDSLNELKGVQLVIELKTEKLERIIYDLFGEMVNFKNKQ